MTADEQHAPRISTGKDVAEALDRLRTETREARHSQANLTQQAIAAQAVVFTEGLDKLDGRLRTIENIVVAASPVSIGGRVNELERWQSRADGDTSLSARIGNLAKEIDELKAWRDEMRGSFTFLKAASVVVGLVSGLAAILSWVSLSRPPVP